MQMWMTLTYFIFILLRSPKTQPLGVICDRRVAAKVKGKLYKTLARPAMLYGLETVALTRKQEMELEVAEPRMLRFLLGVTRLDRIRNEYIRGTAHVGRFRESLREARLRWFGHVLRRDRGYIGQRMLRLEVPGKRWWGRPKKKMLGRFWVDAFIAERTRVPTKKLTTQFPDFSMTPGKPLL